MNRFKSVTKLLMWSMALLLAAFVAGCGGDGSSTSPAGVGIGGGLDGLGKGAAPVVLGAAGNFVILAQSGISTVPNSAVTGDIGVSPIARGGITGFSETMDGTGTFSTSTQVTGKLYAADYTSPTPSNLGTAVLDMQAAYVDAAGRAADFTELGTGNIGGMTLPPATYK